MTSSGNRVVVTGMSVISPLGLDVPSMWRALTSGESGIDRITHFDPEFFDSKIAAEVKGFDPLARIDRKEARHMDRFVQLAVVASLQAVEDAGLRIDGHNANDIGCNISETCLSVHKRLCDLIKNANE